MIIARYRRCRQLNHVGEIMTKIHVVTNQDVPLFHFNLKFERIFESTMEGDVSVCLW